MTTPIAALDVLIDQYMHNYTFIRWKRVHKRRRIAKKWRDRYGAVIQCVPRFYNICDSGIVTCPCGAELLRKQIGEANAHTHRSKLDITRKNETSVEQHNPGS